MTDQARYLRLFLHSLFFILFCFFSRNASAQKVGLVLSGGGANGLAHVGVLKALEENNIPIDYIAGASMGAIVGGLYVSGYSPREIEAMLTSEQFIRDVQGEFDEEYVFFLKKPAPDASMVQLKFAQDQPLSTSLPTNIVSPYALDFKMVEVFGGANAVSKQNFDSLMVPFRCVAANVRKKEMTVFEDGQLNMAVRASSTYPFYYKPILTEGELLYDGGIYNNFPVDIMIREFNPDIIIGSNVSYNYDAPVVNDIMSQLKNMLVSLTDYSLQGRPGIIIEPRLDTSPFDFSDPAAIIQEGYMKAKNSIDSIKTLIPRQADPVALQAKRNGFNSRKPPIVFEEIEIKGVKVHQGNHIRNALVRKGEQLSYEELKPRFLRLFQEEQVKYVYPGITFNPATGKYRLTLDVEKEKDIFIKFGGNFSSKPINTGYVSVKYNYLRENAYSMESNFYFGKYYSSIQLMARMQTAWKLPFYIEPFGTLNRWDYFKSRATFFEEVKPSFIIQNEKFAGVDVGFPLRYKGKLVFDFKVFQQNCNYYLTENFSRTDIADLTQYTGNTGALIFERNTLNRKQYPSRGTYLKLQARYISGLEKSIPGSTALSTVINKQAQNWFSFLVKYDNYFKTLNNLKFGYHVQGMYNTRYLFSNYTSSLIFSPAYQPIPESKTLFLDNYRANKFVGTGLSGILNFSKNLDYRLEAYLFQPINELRQTMIQNAELGSFLGTRYKIFSTSLVYHTPIGPVSASLNYYDRNSQPFSFLFNFGYIIFNKTVYD